jgi:23S rRNA pseudouridine2605 synthase
MAEKSKEERINKYIAAAGICSRRDAERLIGEGRVKVNGQVLTELGYKVQAKDIVEVDGKKIKGENKIRVFVYHKPAGLVTTNRDEKNRPTVFDKLPTDMPRVVTVGRLDMNTEGLLLLTTSGELSRALELPSKGWVRQYRARVHGQVTDDKLQKLARGIKVNGIKYGAIHAELDRASGANTWLIIKLTEGKNREVRNAMEAIDLKVNRLIRVAYGPFQLGQLERGEVREVKGRSLREMLPKEFAGKI